MKLPHLVIVVPAYNAELFIKRCLSSIDEQNHGGPFELFLIDDCSTDSTGTLMDEFEYMSDVPTVVHHNWENRKMPANLLHVQDGNPDDVIIIVDADDYLGSDRMLGIISKAYEDPNLWLTYGSYVRHDGEPVKNPAVPYPPEVIMGRGFRTHPVSCYNHPITFRRNLLQHIEDWELQDDEGQWFQRSYDHAIMMPMLELAVGHFKWIPEPLYVYNEDNPISEIKIPYEGEPVPEIVNRREPRLPLCPYFPLVDPHLQQHEEAQ